MTQLSDRDSLQAEFENLCREHAKNTELIFGAMMRLRQAAPLDREFWNHDIDLYYQWKDTRNPLWLERGIFNGLALVGDGETLDLACGDGFNARNFYSLRSKHVTACDLDLLAIEHAKTYNAAENIAYSVANIAKEFPQGQFDNIILDAAIEHLTQEEIISTLKSVRQGLTERGIFSGYTLVESTHVSIHDTYFASKEDLHKLLKMFFAHVTVFETIYPTRHNLYWYASNHSILPFGEGWNQSVCR